VVSSGQLWVLRPSSVEVNPKRESKKRGCQLRSREGIIQWGFGLEESRARAEGQGGDP